MYTEREVKKTINYIRKEEADKRKTVFIFGCVVGCVMMYIATIIVGSFIAGYF